MTRRTRAGGLSLVAYVADHLSDFENPLEWLAVRRRTPAIGRWSHPPDQPDEDMAHADHHHR